MHIPLQQSSSFQHFWPFGEQSSPIENWTAQGKRKSLQAAAWKPVSSAFVWTDATCSRFSSTPPTPSSSSRAASVTCTATSMMQAMATRWSPAVETLKVVIAMIVKSFSLNTHSPQISCQWNDGSTERGADASAKEIVRTCEESMRNCRFILTRGSTPAQDSYCNGQHTVDSLRVSPKTSMESRTVPWRKRKIFIQHFVIPWWSEEFLSLGQNMLLLKSKK